MIYPNITLVVNTEYAGQVHCTYQNKTMEQAATAAINDCVANDCGDADSCSIIMAFQSETPIKPITEGFVIS